MIDQLEEFRFRSSVATMQLWGCPQKLYCEVGLGTGILLLVLDLAYYCPLEVEICSRFARGGGIQGTQFSLSSLVFFS